MANLQLAIADAAKNSREHHARAVITLRSGVQFEGKLERSYGSGGSVANVILHTEDGGWVSIDMDEIVAVASKPREAF